MVQITLIVIIKRFHEGSCIELYGKAWYLFVATLTLIGVPIPRISRNCVNVAKHSRATTDSLHALSYLVLVAPFTPPLKLECRSRASSYPIKPLKLKSPRSFPSMTTIRKLLTLSHLTVFGRHWPSLSLARAMIALGNVIFQHRF